MKKLFVLILMLLASLCFAETRRALLIGIDEYQPPVDGQKPVGRGTWTSLDGAVNDAESVAQILIDRYGFKPENVHVLKNGEATRERILSEIQNHLLASAQADDVDVFFYAGHGSQVTNSKSTEPDKKDETIVPSDANRGTEIKDIRDKELRRLFYQIVSKKTLLTVLFDSCHSGSVVRGLGKPRKLDPDPRDVADDSDPGPAPEESGALIFSAAQDQELAWEARDEQDLPHGSFSLALIRTLRSADVNEPAEQLFLSVKAKMQSEGRSQEPVLAGNEQRRKMPLFGGEAGEVGATTVAVLKTDDAGLALQGGQAIGLNENCELVGVAKKDLRLRITSVEGLSQSHAEVIAGDPKSVQVGDLFKIDKWVVSSDSALRVWIPEVLPSESTMMAEVSKLKGSPKIDFVQDPTATIPSHLISFELQGWTLYTEAGSKNLGTKFSADSVLNAVKKENQKPALFLEVAPAAALADALRSRYGSPDSVVQLAKTPDSAQYFLVGRTDGQHLEYAWVLKGAMQKSMADSALAVRTDWVALEKDPVSAANQLNDYALRIAKVYGWFRLEQPPDDGEFPYRLGLKNSKTGEVKSFDQPDQMKVLKGETYGLVLIADKERLSNFLDKRFVYVFSIDSSGNSTLLFPRSGAGNVENRVPYDIDDQTGSPTEIPLGGKALFRVGPPYGTDTYILLTTVEPIANPDSLAFEGVKRGASSGSNPLERLLSGVGSDRSRGASVITPTNWSVQRLSIKSAEN